MDTFYQKVVPDELFGGLLRRCGICGQFNNINIAPRLGRYATPASVNMTDSITGKTFYNDNAAANGCALCGSPAWADGGKSGDLSRWIP